MNLSLGIVGLPNVGKSTLFNALTKQAVPAENYPFCTIDPNVGVVAVSDKRVDKLVELSKPAKITPAVVEFVDIAGLVKGAASGEGLGNKFLSNIKEVSAIVHVVRAFSNTNITHVENSLDPKRDIELINTELILKDLDTLENRLKNIQSRTRFEPKLMTVFEYLTNLKTQLSEGKLAIDYEASLDELSNSERNSLFLLTDKPVIYLVNTDDTNAEKSRELIKSVVGNKAIITMDVKTEYELASMSDEERLMFMVELGIDETGLERLTREAYNLLGLISYFTEGPEEVRAWTIQKGYKAPEAAGVIHTDFQKKFITAEVCTFEDFAQLGSWNACKSGGKVRLEGRDYIVRDGDIMIFRHG